MGGLLDTSVVVDLDQVLWELPTAPMAISSLTLAELAAGTHAVAEPLERAQRQALLQLVEATFTPLPFDGSAARAYGVVWAATAAAGRKARGHRAVDLLIAATAVAAGVPLWTRNAADFAGLEDVLDVMAV